MLTDGCETFMHFLSRACRARSVRHRSTLASVSPVRMEEGATCLQKRMKASGESQHLFLIAC